jgi:hypothetical protein
MKQCKPAPYMASSFDVILNGAEKRLLIQPQTIHLLSPSSGVGVGYGLSTLVCVSLPFRTIFTPAGDEIVSVPDKERFNSHLLMQALRTTEVVLHFQAADCWVHAESNEARSVLVQQLSDQFMHSTGSFLPSAQLPASEIPDWRNEMLAQHTKPDGQGISPSIQYTPAVSPICTPPPPPVPSAHRVACSPHEQRLATAPEMLPWQRNFAQRVYDKPEGYTNYQSRRKAECNLAQAVEGACYQHYQHYQQDPCRTSPGGNGVQYRHHASDPCPSGNLKIDDTRYTQTLHSHMDKQMDQSHEVACCSHGRTTDTLDGPVSTFLPRLESAQLEYQSPTPELNHIHQRMSPMEKHDYSNAKHDYSNATCRQHLYQHCTPGCKVEQSPSVRRQEESTITGVHAQESTITGVHAQESMRTGVHAQESMRTGVHAQE